MPVGTVFAVSESAGMNADAGVPEIEIAGVTKQYGNAQTVLESIDLVVAKREFVAIIGPSGCGKSTILKLISGLTAPTSGTIRVDGMTPQNARETISFIFQDATLLPWRTVKENIGLGLELEARAEATARKKEIASLLGLVGLEHVARAYPRELSGRDEDASFDRSRAGHQSAADADGRALRGAR